MALIKKVIEYLLENPFYAIVVAVCCVVILAVIIAICVKKSKIKKGNAKMVAEEKKSANTEIIVSDQKLAANEDSETEQAETIKSIDNPAKNANEQTVVEDENAVAAIEKTIVQEKKIETSSIEVKKQSTTITKENVPSEEIVQATAKKTKRYNGKWTIWRLVTQNIDNTQETEETYFFELHASNGEKLLSSEEYTSFAGAQKGIETHKANILKNNFRICLTKKGDYIFKLLNGKGFLLCTGENYPTKIRCEKAIESTKRFAETAIIDENIHDLVVQLPAEDADDIVIDPDNGYVGKWVISSMLSPDGEQVYYFELFASNGEKLLTSEEYTTYNGVVNGITTHKNNIERNNFRISLTKRGDYIFKLLNANDQLLCLGEHYKTRHRCENAVESVKRFAKTAPIMDSPSVKKLSQ